MCRNWIRKMSGNRFIVCLKMTKLGSITPSSLTPPRATHERTSCSRETNSPQTSVILMINLSGVVPQPPRHSRDAPEYVLSDGDYLIHLCTVPAQNGSDPDTWLQMFQNVTNHHFLYLFPIHLTTPREEMLDNRSMIHRLIISRLNQTLKLTKYCCTWFVLTMTVS